MSAGSSVLLLQSVVFLPADSQTVEMIIPTPDNYKTLERCQLDDSSRYLSDLVNQGGGEDLAGQAVAVKEERLTGRLEEVEEVEEVEEA